MLIARASKLVAKDDAQTTARDQICLLSHGKTSKGGYLRAVEDLDDVFIAPSNIAADMSYFGLPTQPDAQSVTLDAIGRSTASGIPVADKDLQPARRIPGHVSLQQQLM